MAQTNLPTMKVNDHLMKVFALLTKTELFDDQLGFVRFNDLTIDAFVNIHE